MVETVAFLSARAIPVCAHIGLTPQHVHQFGGFKRQGKTQEAASKLFDDAIALADAGARMVLMEAIPANACRRDHPAPQRAHHRHRRRAGDRCAGAGAA